MYRILLRANIKRHKGSLAGIFILTFLTMAALGVVFSVWLNSKSYMRTEMERAGFGELTAWVSEVPDSFRLAGEIEALPEVERVELQSLIFSSYETKGQESDSEGQLIPYTWEDNMYRFFTEDLSGYQEAPDGIMEGEIYVSPSMVSMFGTDIGDEIIFPIARAGKTLSLTVRGFYEDPFMGSSMIGMKGFLVSEKDWRKALDILQNAGVDALARDGAMLHIYPDGANGLTASELSSRINEQTILAEYTEDLHSRDTMTGFMLILQNAFGGILLAFVVVLLLVVGIVLGHSISNTLVSDYVNIGILKTQGLTAGMLRQIQILQYMSGIIAGLLSGFIAAYFLAGTVSKAMLTTIGVLIPAELPLVPCIVTFAAISLSFAGFISVRTLKIGRITPMRVIRGETDYNAGAQVRIPVVPGKCLHFRLALRQLASGKRYYIGAFAVAMLLTFFASLVGRMSLWLGADGKGMMDAFNPADHDIGVQSFGELTREEFEEVIRSYTEITDTYMLAMPQIAVNGISYTANVIDEPERFHILEGKTCMEDDEIVLTEFLMRDFGLSIGDTVTVRADGGSGSYVVSGIYSCANDMGDNVGMSREGYLKIAQDHPNLWCYHYFLADPGQKGLITETLENLYGGDIHVHENTWPGLFGIISAMQALLVFLYGMVFLFILVVTVMTGNKILSAEQKDLGIYKAIGFSSGSLRLTFALRFGMAACVGAAAGTVLAAVLTDPLVGAAMKLAGISNFVSRPGVFGILLPGMVVIFLFAGFGWLSGRKIKSVPLSILVSE